MNRSFQHVILGTGQLGLAIMDELVARHTPVQLVNRSGTLPEAAPPGATVEVVAADVRGADAVAAACAGARVVFFCVQPPYHRWPEEFPPLAESVIEGVARAGTGREPLRLVFGSNLYLYGSTGGAPIHEGLPPAATTRKGRARARVAELLMAAHHSGRVRVTIGRASDFFGPRVTDSVAGEMIFGAALAGKPVNLVGDIDAPHTLTYIRDFARALLVLSEHDEAFGAAWHVPNTPTRSMREFVALVEKEVDRPVKTRVAGPLMLRLIGLFSKPVRETVEMLYEFQEPFVVDHSRYAAAFGADNGHGPTPLETAIAETVAWYRSRPEPR
jgi:nucleoside-diphosphate-sugar epimerase